MHHHFDPVGGIAGDMFVGALLDLYPQHAAGAIAAVRAAGLNPDVSLNHVAYNDGILGGSRFDVGAPPSESPHHHHVHWSQLRRQLRDSALTPDVCDRAVAIFAVLADAEARVHDKSIDEVSFHEVGAWDSIADIVAAAYVIETLGEGTWSIGTIPIGGGRVRTAHGLLPVPAPATVLLLEGLPCFDDGFAGERVTPTGAAIIRHLAPGIGVGAVARTLKGCGYGFGTRKFDGLSNVLRVLAFSDEQARHTLSDTVAAIEFEVDDQSAEDLAVGLDRLRAAAGVIDVVQIPVVGKHGRLGTMIRVLAEPDRARSVADQCFSETTTLGLRLHTHDRVILNRHEVAAGDVNVKIAERPGGSTAKAEMRNVADSGDHRHREAQRRSAEETALRAPKSGS